MAITIRPASVEDAAVVRDIYQMSFSEYQSFLKLSSPPAALQETTQSIAQALQSDMIFLAIYNQLKAVGSIRLSILEDSVGYIGRFAVLPNWQKSGAGSALMEYALAYFSQKGLKAAALHTGTKQIHLARFYHSFGFYVHSVSTDKGYRRGLFVKEFADCPEYDFESICAGL